MSVVLPESTKPNQVQRMNYKSANPEFHVPHKPYYLRKTTHALEEIRSVTNNLQNVPEQFERLAFQLRLPYKANMVYGQFDAPANIAVVKKVNGIDGFFLHLFSFKMPILLGKINKKICKINSRNFTYDGLTFSSSFLFEEVKDEI
jgi:hypothetical protein